jgi:hypothetical protein
LTAVTADCSIAVPVVPSPGILGGATLSVIPAPVFASPGIFKVISDTCAFAVLAVPSPGIFADVAVPESAELDFPEGFSMTAADGLPLRWFRVSISPPCIEHIMCADQLERWSSANTRLLEQLHHQV